jgi:hypothetical protein
VPRRWLDDQRENGTSDRPDPIRSFEGSQAISYWPYRLLAGNSRCVRIALKANQAATDPLKRAEITEPGDRTVATPKNAAAPARVAMASQIHPGDEVRVGHSNVPQERLLLRPGTSDWSSGAGSMTRPQ